LDWIRDCFPGALLRVPRERYARIRHPLRPGLWAERLRPELLFLDLETLGFLGHPVFLIGCLRRCPGGTAGWEVLQLFARDYTEEEAILRAFAGVAAPCSVWVSFNGKSFDVPFLRARAAYYGRRLPNPGEHRDLLHGARRVYRKVLPNCRLQTLESALFGRYRFRDLAGGEIPAAYHTYVRCGNPEQLERILAHNRDDLVSLARLWDHLEHGDGIAMNGAPEAPGGRAPEHAGDRSLEPPGYGAGVGERLPVLFDREKVRSALGEMP